MKSKRVIVVDDDPIIREVLSIHLISRGYEVFTLASGQEAIDSVPLLDPDIVILDVVMPDVDGWEVCKIIKDHYDDQSVKILMLTAKNTDRDRMIGKMILKADEYLTKPFDINELMSAIERLAGDY